MMQHTHAVSHTPLKNKMDMKRSHALELSVLTGNNLRENSEITEEVTTMSTYNDNGECDGDFSSEVLHENATLDFKNEDPPLDVNHNTLDTSRENATDFNKRHRRPFVTKTDLLLLFLPILCHVYDFVSDLCLAIDYFTTQKIAYGCFTVALIIIPATTSIWISSRMRDEDFQEQAVNEEEEEVGDEMRNVLEKIAKLEENLIITCIFQLNLPLRYWRRLCFAMMVRKCDQKGHEVGVRYYYLKLLKEEQNLALLNVIESFLEAAPQLSLQLSILLREDGAIKTLMWYKIVGGCVSLFFLGWCMRKYHRAIRLVQPDKALISTIGGAFVFVWHFGTITGRIIFCGVAASNWPLYTLSACLIISMVWMIWFYTQDGVFAFCRDRTALPHTPRTVAEISRTLLFAAVLAVVYLFTFVNVSEGRTRVRFLVYHILYALQNGIVVILWCTFGNLTSEDVWFSRDILILAVILYFMGIAAMVIYYMFFHPTVRVKSLNVCLSSVEDGQD